MTLVAGLGSGQRIDSIGANLAASRGTTITASATANTKGSYVQLIASTAYTTQAVFVLCDDMAAGIDYLVDISIGPATETVILPNLYFGGGTGTIVYSGGYRFNVEIPSGTRITARCQSSSAVANQIRVTLLLVAMDERGSSPYTTVTTYGVNTATSGGVSVDPGAVAHTKGAYSVITASTTQPIDELYVAIGNQKNTTRTSASWLIDIAIGPATETVIIANIPVNCSSSPDIITPQTIGPIPIQIPVGTRLTARAQSDLATATVRLFDCMLYGVS